MNRLGCYKNESMDRVLIAAANTFRESKTFTFFISGHLNYYGVCDSTQEIPGTFDLRGVDLWCHQYCSRFCEERTKR